MNLRPTKNGLLGIAGILSGVLAALALLAVFVNLPWFDEELHPELVSLSNPRPVSLEGNAYPLALGFLAADERDPHQAGQEMVRALRERYEQGQSIALSPEELSAILGASNLDGEWPARFESLRCNARTSLDCADSLIAEVARDGSRHPRLSVLLDRYDTMIRLPRFEETQERDFYTPPPPYRQLMDVGRLRLAISHSSDSTAEFLSKAKDDVDFWKTILRDSETLSSKMVALAGVQNNLQFVSALMRNRVLAETELETIRRSFQPFSEDEGDIGEAFVIGEARIAVLSEPHPMTYGSSWIARLMIQDNATLNEEYLTVFAPVRLRASLSAREYYRGDAYQWLPYEVRVFPPPVYNLGGKLARKSSWSDGAQPYLVRVHDQNGRISLLLLQAEIEQLRETPVETVIGNSTYRHPYTDSPIEYDPAAQTIGFECMHTVFHPPASPDVCTVAIGSRGD